MEPGVPIVEVQETARWPAHIAELLRARFGDHTDAVLLYGSWLRGTRSTLLDFYVLIDSYSAYSSPVQACANYLLAPNVYHLQTEVNGEQVAAKYAVVSTSAFLNAIANDFHSYFWARFAQPFDTVFVRDDEILATLKSAALRSATRVIEETAPLLDGHFTTDELWTAALRKTYACELRSEGQDKSIELVNHNRDHFDQLTSSVARSSGWLSAVNDGWTVSPGPKSPRGSASRWWRRRTLGKFLSAARLLKAALTFNDALAYVLWKVERHSGIREEASPLQHRYPLFFAWPVLWRLYRRGGFR